MPAPDSGVLYMTAAAGAIKSCGFPGVLERHRRSSDGLFRQVEEGQEQGAEEGARVRRAGEGARGVQTVRGGAEARGHFQKGDWGSKREEEEEELVWSQSGSVLSPPVPKIGTEPTVLEIFRLSTQSLKYQGTVARA